MSQAENNSGHMDTSATSVSPAKESLTEDNLSHFAEADTAQLKTKFVEMESKYIEMSDAYLRAKAEVENIRRRAEEEMSKARRFAVEGFAESLLPVKDSLEAALVTPSAQIEAVLQGVEATLRQLTSALERNKVLEINPAAGTRFDPHHHQAISMVPSDQEANSVVNVLQKGYVISDRVLRPSLVTVSDGSQKAK